MITVQIQRGDTQYISNNLQIFSASNHPSGVYGVYPYSLNILETQVANLSVNAIRNNSEILTIQNTESTPLKIYKSILPTAYSNVTIGDSVKSWNRMHLSSNMFFIENQGIVVDAVTQTMVTPAQVNLNLEKPNDHVFYGPSKKYIVPPGVLISYGGMVDTSILSENFVPKGYLPCDGRLVSITTYNRLYAVIGYTYGGSGSMFALPDFRARSPYGYDTSIPTNQKLGGSSNIILDSSTTMPRHLHNIQFLNGDNPVAEGQYGLIRRSQKNIFTSVKPLTSGYSNYTWNLTDPPRGGTFNTDFTGNVSASSFSILHPYVLVHFLIKT